MLMLLNSFVFELQISNARKRAEFQNGAKILDMCYEMLYDATDLLDLHVL